MKTKQLRILDKFYEPGIRKIEKTNDQAFLCPLLYSYGQGLYEEPNRRETKMIELWETSLANYLASVDEDYEFKLLNEIVSSLAPIYLQSVLDTMAKSDLNTAVEYCSKLSEILPEGVAASQLKFPPQLWLARYHYLHGDDRRARQTVQNLLQVVIELLSDEDDMNDYDAFKRAHSVFTALEDEKNALTALAMVTRESQVIYGTKFGYLMVMCCNGNCGKTWTFPSELWICKHCVNVCLYDCCMTALKEGKLVRNVCHRDPEFIRVPEWDDWGEENITLDEWKQEIRRVYFDSKA